MIKAIGHRLRWRDCLRPAPASGGDVSQRFALLSGNNFMLETFQQ
jgi:hypothetical protein